MSTSQNQHGFKSTITTTQWWQLVTRPDKGPASRFFNIAVDFEKKSRPVAPARQKAA